MLEVERREDKAEQRREAMEGSLKRIRQQRAGTWRCCEARQRQVGMTS